MQKEYSKLVQDEINKYFGGDYYRYFIYLRSYSRWRDDLGRRELWSETVQRYMDFMQENLGDKLTKKEYSEIQNSILNQEVMPSMRLLWSAGEPARKNNIAAFNCSYVAIESLKDFADLIIILTNGCGAGFSCEREAVEKLPTVEKQTGKKLPTHVIDDSKEGWADALYAGMSAWYSGYDLDFDFDKVRPAGARLKIFGGRASGPAPLKELIAFTRKIILGSQGRKLKPIEVHDIVCKIGDVIVSGGVRRTALISLSDLDDMEMRNAKTGAFWDREPQRALSNNSAIYKSKPSQQEFMEEWLALMKSGTGERGIFNRTNFNSGADRRNDCNGDLVGTNPCGEINLLNKEFCNLTSVICRAEDTKLSLKQKARIATILGTYQSMLTDFKYISSKWRENCDDERLLGVSLNGQFDCPIVRKPDVLARLKDIVIDTNAEYAERFGINVSAAIGTIKPEGTCSQMLNCSSGMHPRYGSFYIRRVRISTTDPLFKTLKDQGIVNNPEVGQSLEQAHTFVLEFPIASPKGAITRKDITATQQLEYWKEVKTNYTEHNPSMTCYVAENEWLAVADWIWNNWEIIGGLSFLPKGDSDHVYQLAPYEEISEEKYNELMSKMPVIDFGRIIEYEKDDTTTGAQELACMSGSCDISDLIK